MTQDTNQTEQPADQEQSPCSAATRTWWPLGGLIEDGDVFFPLVSGKDPHGEMVADFARVMHDNGFPESDGLFSVDNFERLKEVTANAGWKMQFIAIGP